MNLNSVDPTGATIDPAARDRAARRVVVIGAGPSGLAAAYELARRDVPPLVLEQGAIVGGLARTESYRGFHFDLGGHRFFTKVAEVEALWRAVLGEQFLRRPRMSRIYYRGKFFHYPLRSLNALFGLGPLQSVAVVLSYLRWQLRPHLEEETFEQWVTNRFGRRLFRTFFKTYTEKVWGISCTELKAEWAAQRIKDLSLRSAVLNMLGQRGGTIKTLIEAFDYPRLGPGMMWRAVRTAIEQRGGIVRTDSEVVALAWEGTRIRHVVYADAGGPDTVYATDFISSMPITQLVARLDPPAPAEVRAAAAQLTYRDFLTVCLIVKQPDLFPDNWIYIHDPTVRVGRIQNFKNWSPEMVPDAGMTSLGLEYFCNEGDELWRMSDADLIELGRREVARIGLAKAEDVVDGCVVRVPKAYPVYDAAYREHLEVVRRFISGFENLQTVGRNGLHRYDNQDHAMLTGMLAVKNLLDGERHDVWSVNTDQEFHEEVRAVVTPDEEALIAAFAKLDRRAFGVAVGVVSGLGLLLATLLLVSKGGTDVGRHLALLAQYFPFYRVTLAGSLLGLIYGGAVGFAVGWTFALVRNATFFAYEIAVKRQTGSGLFGRFLDAM